MWLMLRYALLVVSLLLAVGLAYNAVLDEPHRGKLALGAVSMLLISLASLIVIIKKHHVR